jgi:hypothetical protein
VWRERRASNGFLLHKEERVGDDWYLGFCLFLLWLGSTMLT